MKLQRSSRASLAFSHSVALVLNSVRVVHLDRLTVFEDFNANIHKSGEFLKAYVLKVMKLCQTSGEFL